MAIKKKSTPIVNKNKDLRKDTLTYKRTGSVRGIKIPSVPISASTRDIEDYTTTYTIIRYTNIYGNIKLELKDNHSLGIVYSSCSVNTIKAKEQINYIYKKYGKRKIAVNIIDIACEFDYKKLPYMSKEEFKIEEEVNKKVIVDLKKEEATRVLNAKKSVIENCYKLIPSYIKGATLKVSHNSSTVVKVIISAESIAEGEHLLEIDYNTKQCTYFLDGKKRKTRKSLEKMIK